MPNSPGAKRTLGRLTRLRTRGASNSRTPLLSAVRHVVKRAGLLRGASGDSSRAAFAQHLIPQCQPTGRARLSALDRIRYHHQQKNAIFTAPSGFAGRNGPQSLMPRSPIWCCHQICHQNICVSPKNTKVVGDTETVDWHGFPDDSLPCHQCHQALLPLAFPGTPTMLALARPSRLAPWSALARPRGTLLKKRV